MAIRFSNSDRKPTLREWFGLGPSELKETTKAIIGVGYLLIGAIIILIFASAGYNILTNDIPTAPQFYQSHERFVANPLNHTQILTLTINMNSTTFGAQSPITVLAKIEPEQEDATLNEFHSVELPEYYRIWLDNSYCQRSDDIYEYIPSCYFDLYKTPESTSWYDVSWRGNKTLAYTYGGVFDVHVGIGQASKDERVPVGTPFIQIEDIETTNSFIFGRNSISLNLATLGIATLAFVTSFMTIYISGLISLIRRGFYSQKKK